MSVQINHFGNSCHGDSPNVFNPGHPLSYDLLYQQYGEEGDGTDLGFDNHSDFIPVDEIPDFETEEDFWAQFGMSVIDNVEDLPGNEDDTHFPEEEDPLWQDFLKFFEEPVVTQDDECLCVEHCGCNHRNRDPNVHSRKDEYRMHRSHDHQRRLSHNQRQSIRRMSDTQLIHLL